MRWGVSTRKLFPCRTGQRTAIKVETQLLALAAISVRYFLASCWPGVRIAEARGDDSTLFSRDPTDLRVDGTVVEEEGGEGEVVGGDDAISCGSGIFGDGV